MIGQASEKSGACWKSLQREREREKMRGDPFSEHIGERGSERERGKEICQYVHIYICI